jgi:hypothetical protein
LLFSAQVSRAQARIDHVLIHLALSFPDAPVKHNNGGRSKRWHGTIFCLRVRGFDDLRSMQCSQKGTWKRSPMPEWMNSPDKLQEVITRAVEARAGFMSPQDADKGTVDSRTQALIYLRQHAMRHSRRWLDWGTYLRKCPFIRHPRHIYV